MLIEEFNKRISKENECFELIDFFGIDDKNISLRKPIKIKCLKCGTIIELCVACSLFKKIKCHGCLQIEYQKILDNLNIRILSKYDHLSPTTHYEYECIKCGKKGKSKLSDLIYRQKECNVCKWSKYDENYYKENFVKNVDQNKYQFIKFIPSGTNNKTLPTCEIKHIKCGNSFEYDYYGFIRNSLNDSKKRHLSKMFTLWDKIYRRRNERFNTKRNSE